MTYIIHVFEKMEDDKKHSPSFHDAFKVFDTEEQAMSLYKDLVSKYPYLLDFKLYAATEVELPVSYRTEAIKKSKVILGKEFPFAPIDWDL